jgi:hypothetical protein
MDFFPDGHQVRLQSRGRKGMYLHAGDDGVGVYLSRERASLHAAWQVHRVVRDGETYVLLHGAAYGRYLKATDDPEPSGHLGRDVVQGVYDDEDDNAVYWLPAAGPADGASTTTAPSAPTASTASGAPASPPTTTTGTR